MTNDTRAACLCLVGRWPGRVWGLTPFERLKRVAARLGTVAYADPQEVPAATCALFVRADVLVEDRLLHGLLDRPGAVLVFGDHSRPAAACADPSRHQEALRLLADAPPNAAGWRVLRPEDPELSFNTTLRKRETPYVLDLAREPLSAVQRRLFGASYKGATDFVTKWVWPWPAYHVTRACAGARLTPNMVTAASLGLVFVAMALFAEGRYGLGLLAAWPMTFLDTVDGKLARVTVTSSKWGNVFDHGIDLIHPPFWYWAWWLGLQDHRAALTAALIIMVGGYVVGRLQEGAFIALFKFEMHIWRPFDYVFRTVTARRNPNLFILMVGWLCGRPDLGFAAVAIWTVISLAIHFVRLAQAMLAKAAGRAVLSFLEEAKT